MAVIEQIVASIWHRDEQVNEELALEIVIRKDRNLVSVVIALLVHEDKKIQSDAIKVLCEIGV